MFNNIYNFVTVSIHNVDEAYRDVLGIAGLVILISLSITTFFLILYYTKYLRKEYRETTITVYNRKNEINFTKFLNKANKEIHIFGITLEDTTNNFLDLIEDKLKSPEIRKVRVLLVNPENKLTPEISNLVNSDISIIKSTLNRLQQSQETLGSIRRKLEIRLFNGIPIQSMVILDPRY